MVNPMFVLAAAQTTMNILQGSANARAQNKLASRNERLNAKVAASDAVASFMALSARRLEERRQLFNTLDAVTRDAQRRSASASVSAAEAGVGGKSVGILLQNFRRTQLENSQNILDTENFAQQQYAREAESINATYYQRLVAGQQSRSPGPNYLQEFLNLTASIISAKNNSNARTPSQ